jgi:hypothetical protein
MKSSLKLTIGVIFLVCSLWFSGRLIASEEPLVLLIQAKGAVAYSTDGNKWKPIHRNKFLYNDWQVKTEKDATCKLLHLDSNKAEQLEPETEAIIKATGTKLIRGSKSDLDDTASFTGFLRRKYAKVQKYTSVQRKADSDERIYLNTAVKIKLSPDYPEIVWQNAGPEYGYRLVVGDDIYEIPESGDPLIRFRLKEMEPGEYTYHVQVTYEGEVLYSPEKQNTLIWQSREESLRLRDKIIQIKKLSGDDGYLLGNLLDEEGITVAAMDYYQDYLKENPGANEVRPFLVKVLHELGLSTLEEKEILAYQEKVGQN